MPNCNQCGSDNPANATQCKFCQGPLQREESDEFMRKAHINDVDCPKCNASFMLPKKKGNADHIKFNCPSCRVRLYYDCDDRLFKNLGPRDEPFTIHEDQSLNEDRACEDCIFFKKEGKYFTKKSIFISIILLLAGISIIFSPVFIFPSILIWYKWLSIIPVSILIMYVYFNTLWDNLFWNKCEINEFYPENENPNLRCKHWIKK